MKRSSAGNNAHKNEPPVEQYRKEIGKHQEVIENPNSIKKRQEHKEKVRGDLATPETPQDNQTAFKKFIYMVLIWVVLFGGAYVLIQYLMKPTESHHFTEDQ